MKLYLKDLEVMVLDCQATGAWSAGGHLLEIGWGLTSGSPGRIQGLTSAHSVLVAGPDEIPGHVKRVTGLTAAQLAGGPPAGKVWKRLAVTAANVAAASDRSACPTVVHYARFETPYLKALHQQHQPGRTFPLDIICTHEIARRLFAKLPRKGLRAVAGFLGLTVAPLRRCQIHLDATVHIWKNVVARLETNHGIRTWQQLSFWLRTRPAPAMASTPYDPFTRRLRQKLPSQPGIYTLVRPSGEPLYVGKATSLKQRIGAYRGRRGKTADHILEMLCQAGGVVTHVTASALEAALLETDEIKRLSPPYNIALQEGQRSLWYCSRDYQWRDPHPDALHCRGPLPSAAAAEALCLLVQALTPPHGCRLTAPQWGALTGISRERLPQTEVLNAALGQWTAHNADTLAHRAGHRALVFLGCRLWHQLQMQQQPSQADSAEASARKKMIPAESDTLSPQTLSRRLDALVMTGSLHLRRARWYCLLSESTLAWAVRDSKNGDHRVLIIEEGRVLQCNGRRRMDEIPPPVGSKRKMMQRQSAFDVGTYDRMRTLTTEIRRIAASGRPIRLHIGPRRVLNTGDLNRWLTWV